MSVDPRSDPLHEDAATPRVLDRERVAVSLLRRAGRRNAPPVDASHRVYAALFDVWATEVERRHRLARRMAIAAGVAAIAACAATWSWHKQVSATNVASVTRLTPGAVVMRGEKREQVAPRFELKSGDRIDVPAGSALAAQRADGLSVRVSGPAYLVWDSAERIRLDRGRVYVDLGTRRDSSEPFEVRTPLARIEHLGTRFVADASAARVRVAVRDGRVRMTSVNGDALGLESGQAAEAAVSGHIAWATAPARTDWEWVDALAPPCGIEGRPLLDVLTELSREGDLQLVFASPAIERRARELTLHGPALELPPRTAIDAVVASTDLDADVIGQRVVLRERMTGT